jgi:hypothetical protein
MYIKPTEEMILTGLEDGWTREECERGYTIFDYQFTGMECLMRIDSVYVQTEYDVTDEDCAIEAQRSGVCKITPVNELPKHMIVDDCDLRTYVWVDTEENRKRICEYFANQNKEV